MNIELWWQGKTRDKYLQPGIDDYRKRISFYNRFDIKEFSASKVKHRDEQVINDDQSYLRQLDSRSLVVLLDEKGESMTSKDFSVFCEKILVQPVNKVVFVIGGAYGFGATMRARANYQVRLSSMTFTHDMVRLIFLEQLYRAFSIINNLPYHH